MTRLWFQVHLVDQDDHTSSWVPCISCTTQYLNNWQCPLLSMPCISYVLVCVFVTEPQWLPVSVPLWSSVLPFMVRVPSPVLPGTWMELAMCCFVGDTLAQLPRHLHGSLITPPTKVIDLKLWRNLLTDTHIQFPSLVQLRFVSIFSTPKGWKSEGVKAGPFKFLMSLHIYF